MSSSSSAEELALVLGLETPPGSDLSMLALIDEIGRGLPVTSLDRLAAFIAPQDRTFTLGMIPKATLVRRRKDARLSPDESAKVARLADVWAFAREVWGGEEAARAFLHRPHPLLEGRKPVDVVLANEFGRPLVEGILGRLKKLRSV